MVGCCWWPTRVLCCCQFGWVWAFACGPFHWVTVAWGLLPMCWCRELLVVLRLHWTWWPWEFWICWEWRHCQEGLWRWMRRKNGCPLNFVLRVCWGRRRCCARLVPCRSSCMSVWHLGWLPRSQVPTWQETMCEQWVWIVLLPVSWGWWEWLNLLLCCNIGECQSLGECISPLRWLPIVIYHLLLRIVWGDVVVVAACLKARLCIPAGIPGIPWNLQEPGFQKKGTTFLFCRNL